MEALQAKMGEQVAEGLAPLSTQIKDLADKVSEVTAAQVAEKSEDTLSHTRVMLATIEAETKQRQGKSLIGGSIASDVEATLEKRYGSKDPVFVKSVKEMYKDLMVTGNGGNLVNEVWAANFLDQLWDNTIMDKMGITHLPTQTGNLNIPKIVEGLAAAYIGEGQTVDTSTLVFGHIRLSTKKLMAIVPISNDLIRSAAINVEALVAEQLRKTMASTKDTAFLYGKGGLWEPRGIKNVEGVLKEDGLKEVSRSLGLDMLAQLGKNNHTVEDAYFVMGWNAYRHLQDENVNNSFAQYDELLQGKFLGRPIIVTNRVETSKDGKEEDFFLIKANDVTAIQKYDLSIVASPEASIQTKGGVISAFATDFTFVRATAEHDFGLDYKHSAVIARVKFAK